MTTVELSHSKSTCLPENWCPQITQLNTIGVSSLTIMLRCAHWGGQAHWNHYPYPQPQTPKLSGGRESNFFLSQRNELNPFHSVRKVCHQQKSEQNSMFSLVWKFSSLKLAAVAYIRATKALPHLPTFVVCCRDPTREGISRFFAPVWSTHSATSFCDLTSFSCGNLASIVMVSKMIPKKGRAVDGPSTFSKASGTPR